VIVFLDAAIVIYFVEQPATWGSRAAARIAAIRAGRNQLAVSDLVRMECFTGPLKNSNLAFLNAFTAFFGLADVKVLAITPSVCDRAARVRATHNFKPLDSLHLAAAVEHGCDQFLTNDQQLARFADIAVEVLT
jgi:predicted nucleic acid-binding protein